MYFLKAASPLRHVRNRPGQVLYISQPRRMSLDPVEVEALDMPDLIDHFQERRGDQALGKPGRQQPFCTIRTADRSAGTDRHLHRPKNQNSGTT